MKLDMFTLLTMLCIANFTQFIIFFIQYRVNKIYHGIGFWVLGYASMTGGYLLLFLRGFISIKLLTIISANSLILFGWIFLYIGIMRFLEKKESRGILFSLFTAFILSFVYYTYFNDDIKMRTVIIYSASAVISLLTAKGLFSGRNYDIKASLYFNFSLFIIHSCFYAYRPFDVMIFESFNSLFTPTLMQTVSFLYMFVEGILITFGLIVMVNQRLNSEMKEDKENLELIFKTSPDAVLITRLSDGNFVGLNESFISYTGFSREEVIGKTALEINLWADPKDRRNLVTLLIENGICENIDIVFRRKDGSLLKGLLSARIIYLQGIPHIISVTRDLSERMGMVEALRESELKYRSLIENTSDVVFCVNEKGEYQFANNVFASTFGQNPDYFIGKTFWDIYPKEHADQRQEASRKVFETGESQTIEVSVPLPDRTMYFLAKANPIKDESGKVILNLTTATDITERKDAEEALRKSEEKFRQLIENSHDIIYTLTAEGFFTYVSPSWTVLLGHSAEQVIGQSFQFFVNPDDIPGCMVWLRKVIETGQRQEGVEYRVQHLDGTWYWHTSSAVPLVDDTGRVLGFEGTARDITDRKLAEDALRRSEERIRSINNNMQSGMIYQIVINKNGTRKFTYLSDSVRILYGITPEEGMADPDLIYSKVHEDDITRLAMEEEDAIKTVSTFKSELRVQTPSGKLRWSSFVSIPKVLNDGSICFDGIEFDITERKQAEEALRVSEQKYRLLTEFSSDVIWVLNLTIGTFTFMSPVVYQLRGLSVEEAISEKLEDSLTEDSLAEIQKAIELYVDEFVKNPDKPISYIAEVRQPCKDGSIIWVEISCKLRYNELGEIEVVGVSRNIEKRKRIEQALRESEEKLSTLFGSMTEMVALHDLVFNEHGDAVNYRITDCNNAFTKITGIKREDAVGNLASEVYKIEPAPYLNEFSSVALTGVPYEYTTYFEPLDKHFSISAVSPKKNSFATITTDISGIRKVQEVISAKNKELENYLYIASHDLRSPLVNIQGFSRRLQKQTDSIKSLLSECSLTADTKSQLEAVTEKGIPDTLHYIFSSVTKMDNLLNGLLNVSRTGRTLVTIKEIDVNRLFKTIMANYNFQLSELDAAVKAEDLPPCYGDEHLLNQLFSNIIGNAIKYRDKERKLVIEITGRQEFMKVIYSIRDNGPGIEQRHLEKIWDIFYRVDAAQSDAGEGLGLSIVRRIAEKHNGKAWVESEHGKGSVFYVELQRNEFS